MKRLLAASLTAFAVLTVTPATADMSSRRDADDVHGALDIKRIVHGHTEGGKLWHKVVMWKRWGARDLAGEDEIRFYFSNDREDRYDEVHASVAVEDGKLAAWVFEYTEGSDYAGVGPSKRIRFVRPDRFSVKIFFSDDLMKNAPAGTRGPSAPVTRTPIQTGAGAPASTTRRDTVPIASSTTSSRLPSPSRQARFGLGCSLGDH